MLGQIFNRLTVISPFEPYVAPNGQTKNKWLCLCSCGKEKTIREDHLLSGAIQSCGCLSVDTHTTHGFSKCQKSLTKEERSTYDAWDSMIQRCTNTQNRKYAEYGGRGIKVCDRWLVSFENFLQDMGVKPEKNLSLDRIDVNGDYCTDNCRWTTASEQGYNQRIRSTNTSGRTGICWDKKNSKWLAQITFQNKNVVLGRFTVFEDAVRAREEAEIKYFGKLKN